MKTGTEIGSILRSSSLGVRSDARSFTASTTPPPNPDTAAKLSTDDSEGECLAWREGTVIKYYAEGYTDASPARKIPLNADSSKMFQTCTALTSIDVSGFDTSNVTSMLNMFSLCYALTSITGLNGWNTSNVTTMAGMFGSCEALIGINVSSFDTSRVETMASMFYCCYALTAITGLNYFDTSNVTSMYAMFYRCEALTDINVSSFNTSNVTNMQDMFHYCKVLTTLDLSSFDTSRVESMTQMFWYCNALTTIYASASFVTTGLTDTFDPFYDNSNLVGGAGTTFSSSRRAPDYARIDGGPYSSTPGYFTVK